MSPRVSVIIPVHNAERYMDECLTSVQRQTERDIEIILVDDTSRDRSVTMIEEAAATDPRIRLLHTTSNKGAGHARNLGVEAAHGVYLAFLDADDFFEPTFLEEAGDALDSYEADLVITKSTTYEVSSGEDYETGWTFVADQVPSAQPFSYRDMPGHIFNTFSNVPWNRVFRASFVARHHLRFQEVFRTNDLLFTCSALVLAGRIVTIPKPFTHYRVGALTNSQATNERQPLAFFEAFQALHDVLDEHGILPEVEQSFVNHALDGFLANMASQRTFEGCRTVFEARHTYDQAFGISSRPTGYFYNTGQIESFRKTLDDDFEHFLFSTLLDTRIERNAAWERGRVIERQMWENFHTAKDLKERNRELEANLDELNEACAQQEERIGALEGARAAVEGSLSFRIGRTLTAPGRRLRDLLS